MDLVIVRHGRPTRVEGANGAADPSLNDLGRAQADAVARFLLGEPIDHVVTSPMKRARETARPLAEALDLAPEVVADLAEIDKDADSYVPVEEMKAEGGALWQAVVDDPVSLHGEVDIEAFADLVTAAFERIIAGHPGETVAVFCHGMVTMSFLRRILGYPDIHGLRIDYGSITRVQAATRNPVRSVRSVNETGHLGGARIVSP